MIEAPRPELRIEDLNSPTWSEQLRWQPTAVGASGALPSSLASLPVARRVLRLPGSSAPPATASSQQRAPAVAEREFPRYPGHDFI